MKAEFLAEFTLAGASLSGEEIPKEKRLAFTENDDIKNSLAVRDNDTIYGYITGSEAALLKTFINRKMNLFCLYAGKVEDEDADRHVIKVYYIPEKI